MHLRKIIIFSIIFLLGAGSISIPFKAVRIGILSRYRLNKIEVIAKDARLFFSNVSIQIVKEKISITRAKDKLIIKVSNRRYTERAVRISTGRYLTINFWNNKEHAKRFYSGTLDIKAGLKSLTIINTVPLEEYVHSAAIAELGSLLHAKNKKVKSKKWKQELLASMEVAIRSYIFRNHNRHGKRDYQFCDLTHCVHFPGISFSRLKNKTGGRVLIDNDGKFLSAYFHSTCGGVLTGPEVYWPGHDYIKYFRRGPDKILPHGKHRCSDSPHYKWKYFISMNNLRKILKRRYFKKFNTFSKQGRLSYLMYYDRNNEVNRISASKFISRAGRILGWSAVKSNYFVIEKVKGGYLFRGNGLGHGIGLCQWGAYKMSLEGKGHGDILRFYYNNAKIIECDNIN
ncbi:SpoIID/LytB domain-containing protein [Spirochaetota bacterium]